MAKKVDPGQIDIFESDTRSHEYSVVIHPDWAVSNKVKELRHLLRDQISREPHDLHTRPHITLYDCSSTVCQNDYVESQVKAAIKEFRAFDIAFDGTDYWESGTFFIRINEPKAIQRLTASIKKNLTLPKPHQANSAEGKIPHLTISRFITKKEMGQISPAEFEMKASFKCNAITILKKAEGENSYQELAKLRLG